MTNPGHVDPDFVQIKFTLVNMGGEDFPLVAGDSISRHFFRLPHAVAKDYSSVVRRATFR